MKHQLLLALVLSLFLALAKCDGTDSNVIVLNSDNWKETLQKHEFTAIKYYAPWCGHCKKLAPVWDELSLLYKDVAIAKIDCTINSDKCSDVRGYPTLKFFRKDVADDDQYDGDRDLNALKAWIDTKKKGVYSDVVEFNTVAELEKAVGEYDSLFVFFYAPWCGWCKKIKPIIEKVGTHFNTQSDKKKLLVAKIDSVANNNAAATKYDIKVFPTFYFIRGKKQQIHPTVGKEFSRTYEQFVEWLTPRAGSASYLLESEDDLVAYRLRTPFKRFLAYVGTSGSQYDKWLSFAESGLLDDFGRAHLNPSGNRKQGFVYVEDVKGQVVGTFDLSGNDDFKQFAIKHGYTVGDKLTDEHLRAQATTKIPLFVAYYQGTPSEEQLAPFRIAAEQFAGKFLSGWSDDTEQASKWGTSGSKFPTAVVVRGLATQDTYYVAYDEDVETWNSESLISYLRNVEKDTYNRYIRSEPIPETQGQVKTLVGKNFEDIVFDDTKDVFVEFYAPWCGHCKKLAPIWDELAQLFEPIEDIVIAKIDATANTLPRGINANSYPTIMWFPKNNKLPIVYNQGRTLDNLKRYVISQATRKNIDLEKETQLWKDKNQKADL